MKLSTDIIPRADGTVVAHLPGGVDYEFKLDGKGRLICEVDDEDHVGFLLDSGNFHPHDERDLKAGVEVVAKLQSGSVEGAGTAKAEAAGKQEGDAKPSDEKTATEKSAASAKPKKAAGK